MYGVWNRGGEAKKRKEGEGDREGRAPRDEVSVGEVVEVGQSGGKRDVWWSGRVGGSRLGYPEGRGKGERARREGGADGGDERGIVVW